MGKLYKDVDLTEPFQVTFDNQTFDAYANEDDTITIGSTSYLRVKDSTGRSVKAVIADNKAHQLIVRLNESDAGELCYIEGEGAEAAAMSTTVQVIDAVIPPSPTYTINYSGVNGSLNYDTLPYEGQIDQTMDWDVTFTLDPTNLTGYIEDISQIISMNPQIALLTCTQGTVKINSTTVGNVDFDPTEIRTYVSRLEVSKSGSYTVVIHNIATSEDTTLTGTVSGDISGIVTGLTPAQVATNLIYRPENLDISATLNIYS